jgi:translation elongation factor P/translation initiation factor 5A
MLAMASMLEAIEIKRKSYFEYEGAPYNCLDVEVSKPTARGGQTLVRIKMRNMLTQAVFDKTFKAGEIQRTRLAFIKGGVSMRRCVGLTSWTSGRSTP